MSIITKVVTGIFGKKSDRDMKVLSPFIDEINSVFNTLGSLSDDALKDKFQKIRDSSIEKSAVFREELISEGLEKEDLEEGIYKNSPTAGNLLTGGRAMRIAMLTD